MCSRALLVISRVTRSHSPIMSRYFIAQVFGSGAIDGGFCDVKRLRAMLYRELEEARRKETGAKQEHVRARVDSQRILQAINDAHSDVQKNRAAIDHIRARDMLQEIEEKRESDASLSESIRCKEEQERRLQLSLDTTKVKIDSLNKQSHQVFQLFF